MFLLLFNPVQSALTVKMKSTEETIGNVPAHFWDVMFTVCSQCLYYLFIIPMPKLAYYVLHLGSLTNHLLKHIYIPKI